MCPEVMSGGGVWSPRFTDGVGWYLEGAPKDIEYLRAFEAKLMGDRGELLNILAE